MKWQLPWRKKDLQIGQLIIKNRRLLELLIELAKKCAYLEYELGRKELADKYVAQSEKYKKELSDSYGYGPEDE